MPVSKPMSNYAVSSLMAAAVFICCPGGAGASAEVVPYQSAVQEPQVFVVSSMLAVVMVLLVFRGCLGTMRDVWRMLKAFGKLVWPPRMVDTAVQTDTADGEGLSVNIRCWSTSEVYHVEGCRHVNQRMQQKRPCEVCRRR